MHLIKLSLLLLGAIIIVYCSMVIGALIGCIVFPIYVMIKLGIGKNLKDKIREVNNNNKSNNKSECQYYDSDDIDILIEEETK